MNKQQAHTLKLKIAVFAECTAMLEYAKKQGQAELDTVLAERDRVRVDVYGFIDSLVTEE